MPIRVVLADDSFIVREGIRELLQSVAAWLSRSELAIARASRSKSTSLLKRWRESWEWR